MKKIFLLLIAAISVAPSAKPVKPEAYKPLETDANYIMQTWTVMDNALNVKLSQIQCGIEELKINDKD